MPELSRNRPELLSARRRLRWALLLAVVWSATVGTVVAIVGRLNPGGPPEAIFNAVTWPLWVVTRALSGLINLIGDAGRQEPASYYLSEASVRLLAGLSFVIYFAFLATVGYGLLSGVALLRRRSQTREADDQGFD